MKRTRLLTLILMLACGPAALAEHRAALLIDNSAHSDGELAIPRRDMKLLAGGLERYGFRCEIVQGLDEKELQQAVDSFAERTPTRGTALVLFSGQALPGSYNGKEQLCLLGVSSKSGRGLGVRRVFEALTTRGGSLHNLLILACPKTLANESEIPGGCLLARVDGNRFSASLTGQGEFLEIVKRSGDHFQMTLADGAVTGAGSTAISPPSELKPGNKPGDEWVNGRGMVFCWCPAGKYTAGSPDDTPGRYPDEAQREVVIEKGFWIAKYEWSQGRWIGNRHRGAIGEEKLHPVNMVSQSKDTLARAVKPLNESERKAGNLPSGWSYGLPTEDQWEYAARAGTKTRFYFGDDVNQLPRHANFADKSFYDTGDIYSNAAHRRLDDGFANPAPVGSYLPNPWGLHDIYGNVAEWCDDSEVRGGGWVSAAENCRSAYRDRLGDRDQRTFVGVRLVIRQD